MAAYPGSVDGTTQALLAALIGAGVAAAAVFAWALSDRLQRTPPPVEEPVLPPGIATVLSVLRSSAVVLGEDDVVVKASAPAYSLGLVKGHALVSTELAGLVEQVRRDGTIRETELLMSRPDGLSPRHVTARVAPLSSRLVLALVEDRTRERQIEAVRRDFVANVSHELKTPVGAIRLLAEAVHDAAEDPEAVQRFSGRMITESERLTRLVQQIIELSRLQADDPIDTPVPVQVDEVVKTAVDTSAIDADAARISVVSGGTSDLEVLGNAEQITAAVANLVANAIAYSGEGSTVLVSTKGLPESVEISVVDQGIGIPEHEVGRIFERFYRVDPARHRSTGGTGLGLSIVKHVAATHGGDISVWSVEGQGSTFTLTLPRRKQETDR
jgi:two-component system sensor histidine kinase SenX3